MSAEHQVADSGAHRASGTSLQSHASSPTILCSLWVVVIALAVAIDLAK